MNGLSLSCGCPKLEMPKEEMVVSDNSKLSLSHLRLKLVQTFRGKQRRTEVWVAWEDGRARVCPASLLTYHYPAFFLWEGNSSQAAFTLSAPHLCPRGASGQCPPHHSGNSRQLSLSPLPPLQPLQGLLILLHRWESPPPPDTTHSAVTWGKQPDPSKSFPPLSSGDNSQTRSPGS